MILSVNVEISPFANYPRLFHCPRLLIIQFLPLDHRLFHPFWIEKTQKKPDHNFIFMKAVPSF